MSTFTNDNGDDIIQRRTATTTTASSSKIVWMHPTTTVDRIGRRGRRTTVVRRVNIIGMTLISLLTITSLLNEMMLPPIVSASPVAVLLGSNGVDRNQPAVPIVEVSRRRYFGEPTSLTLKNALK